MLCFLRFRKQDNAAKGARTKKVISLLSERVYTTLQASFDGHEHVQPL